MSLYKSSNDEVAQYLVKHPNRERFVKILDIPCGDGRLTRLLKPLFPSAQILAADIQKNSLIAEQDFRLVDASRPFDLGSDAPFDLICSVSGVMDFENTASFVEMCARHLKPNGSFIITNDNIASFRDRLSFFLFGKFRRFALFFQPGDPTFKALPIQELHKILREQGFAIEKIRYCCVRPEDFLLLPFALPLYLIQALYLLLMRAPLPIKERFALYPWQALIHRHYFISCLKQ